MCHSEEVKLILQIHFAQNTYKMERTFFFRKEKKISNFFTNIVFSNPLQLNKKLLLQGETRLNGIPHTWIAEH